MTSMRKQQGAVMVIAVMMLLIMTTMGVGLIQYAKQESQQVTIFEETNDALLLSDSCIEEAVQYLEQLGASSPPCETQAVGSQCGSTVSNRMNAWGLSGEHAKMAKKSVSQTYSCRIYVASREALGGSSGAGFNVGQQNVYGQTAIRTKYLYRIRASSNTENNAKTDVEVIASMVY